MDIKKILRLAADFRHGDAGFCHNFSVRKPPLPKKRQWPIERRPPPPQNRKKEDGNASACTDLRVKHKGQPIL